MGKALYIQSVEDAAEIAGGYERLAAALGVTREDIDSWVSGAAKPECAVFLRLIEIVLDPVLPRAPGLR
jgi:DNA-binding phage protein